MKLYIYNCFSLTHSAAFSILFSAMTSKNDEFRAASIRHNISTDPNGLHTSFGCNFFLLLLFARVIYLVFV
uniref:Uncharacterized protein n=1 Tax=Trichogramma kaykai TaxID=54128 RepID=A0ABD2X5T9_9HYME